MPSIVSPHSLENPSQKSQKPNNVISGFDAASAIGLLSSLRPCFENNPKSKNHVPTHVPALHLAKDFSVHPT
jgi:hypothetical protein